MLGDVTICVGTSGGTSMGSGCVTHEVPPVELMSFIEVVLPLVLLVMAKAF